ncbi:WD40 repeat domain-containing protein [Dictyoglomus thermophilum]|uniref:WD40 repeat domain-containing protein n=1 Tax=Dictyoglomus thermophilum (strain ATCC 35947 / DSM 3960 / H-6-12) TaxID=309799 RepID=B5YCY2_DICT6|nr:hypothetical protein [Dictyoglomus thermophilum]ACI20041.1 hypothetical protein DICTH_0507 [Dictyoglomus thermophilum H-6-12]
MKKIIIGSIALLTIGNILSQNFDVVPTKSIVIGTEALNYFLTYNNSLIYAFQDQITLLDLNTFKETKLKVKSSKAQNFNTYIVKFKILSNGDIAVINNEPYIILWNPLKNNKIELPFNIEYNRKDKNNFLISKTEIIEDLDISNTAKFVFIKNHISQLFLNFIPIEDYYEYKILSYPDLKEIISWSSKEINFDNIAFSTDDNFVILRNVTYPQELNKSYGLKIYDLSKQKEYNLLPNTTVIDFDIAQNSKLIAISTEESGTKIFDLKTLNEVFKASISGYVRFSPLENLLILEGNNTINIFDIKSKNLIETYLGSNPSLSPSQTYLAYAISKNFASLSKEINIVNRYTKTQNKINFKEEYFVEDIQFSRDENFLITMLSGKDGYKIEIFKKTSP